jgi:hypothetical protein
MGQQLCHAGRSGKPCELMSGGPSRFLYLSDYQFSSFIPLGLLFRGGTIFLVITFRHFIRLRSLEIRHTAGSDRSLTGGPSG